MLVLEGLVGIRITVQFQLKYYSLDIDLGYCGIEWHALKTNRDHSVIFAIIPNYCILDSFIDYDGYSILL